MRKILILSLITISLSGCAVANYMQSQETKKTVLDCKQKYDDGETTAVKSAKCMNDAWLKYVTTTNDPNGDVILLCNAHRMQLAKKVDAGKMTKEAYEEDMARFASQQMDRIQGRNAAAQVSNAAQSQATGTLLQGIASWNQSMQPKAPVTCVSNPPFTTCH